MSGKDLIEAVEIATEKESEAYKQWQSTVGASSEAKKALAWHKSGLKPGDRVEYKSGNKWVSAVAHDFCKSGWWLHVRRILKDGSISDSTVNAYSRWRKP